MVISGLMPESAYDGEFNVIHVLTCLRLLLKIIQGNVHYLSVLPAWISLVVTVLQLD